MRPSRSKRPPVAADGTLLAAPRIRTYTKRAKTRDNANDEEEDGATASSPARSVSVGGSSTAATLQSNDASGAHQTASRSPVSVRSPFKDRTPVNGSNHAEERIPEATPLTRNDHSDADSDISIDAGGAKEKQAEPAVALTQKSLLVESPMHELDVEVLSRNLLVARKRILSVLGGELPPAGEDGSECLGLEEQWRTLHSTLRGTIRGQEGNSALLVGAPGSGKSLLLNSVLRSLSEDATFHVVHLDAALQTTDRLSLRELARQLLRLGAIKPGSAESLDLGLDVEDEEEQDEEHEEDVLSEGEDGGLEGAVLSSLANTASAILTLLSSGNTGRPLIIVLSAFELLTARPRQALLYVLLDAVQAGSYMPGLCVLGLTSRVDTTDLLEKRVRSRFSGRVIDVWPGATWPDALRKVLHVGHTGDQAFDSAWSNDVHELLKDARVLEQLEAWSSTANDFASLYKIMFPIVASLTANEPSVHAALLSATRPAPAFTILNDLTTPEFALLIAAKQLLNKDREVFNFAMCYDELRRFVSRVERDRLGASTSALGSSGSSPARAHHQRSIGVSWTSLLDRRRVLMAFRSLLSLELFQPEALLNAQAADAAASARRATQTVSTEFLRVKCTVFPQTIIEVARSKARTEALGMHLVQWAQASG